MSKILVLKVSLLSKVTFKALNLMKYLCKTSCWHLQCQFCCLVHFKHNNDDRISKKSTFLLIKDS